MAKKVIGKIKLQLQAGKANPAPPVGPALGQHGVNIMEFCKQYNAGTADKAGQVVPVEITVFEDRSFAVRYKPEPAAVMIRKAAKLDKGASKTGMEQVGTITRQQAEEIAKAKMVGLNAHTLESAVQMVRGTARSMGIAVED